MARRRIRVAEFRGEDVELEFADGSVYPVRGDMLVDVVLMMAELEDQSVDLNEDNSEFTRWLGRAKGLLHDLIAEKTPSVGELPPLSVQEIMGTFGSLIGGDSVSGAIIEALNAGFEGVGGDQLDEIQRKLLEGEAEAGEKGDADEVDDPLPQAKRSSKRSVGSRSGTAGSRAGGARAAGRSSSSSSSSRTKARAA